MKIFLFHTLPRDPYVDLVIKVIENCFADIQMVYSYENCDVCIIGGFPEDLEKIELNFLLYEKINFFVIGESSEWFKYFRNLNVYKDKKFLNKVYVIGMEKDFLVGKKFINLPYWKSHIDWFKNNSNLISLNEIKNNKWKAKNKEMTATFISSYKYWDTNIMPASLQRYKYVEMLENNFLYINQPSKEEIEKRKPFIGEMGEGIRSKLDFISNYLVHLPFENAVVPGYVTEKLFHGLLSGSINLYYGHKNVENDFNKNAFFTFNDEESFFVEIEKIKSILSSKNKIQSFLQIDPFLDNINIDFFINEIYSIVKK